MRRFMPIRTLQVAATVTTLLFAQAPAFAQPAQPAPAPTASPAPAPAPEPAPAPSDPGAWSPGSEPPADATTPTEPAPAPEPAPEPEPAAAAPEAPQPAPAAPVDTAQARTMRNAGIGTMIAGGVVSLAGFGMTLGFTLKGNKLENDLIAAEDAFQKDNCSREPSKTCDGLEAERDDIRNGIVSADRMTRVAGGILVGGLLVTAIGGIIYRIGVKRLTNANVARVRVSPTFGGLSISGRF